MAAIHPTHVTTTGSIEGWEIVAHLGVVSTSIVAGTGLFTEFLAGWADLFGGRSAAFRNQLETLHREAVAQLLSRANLVGANWLIGLHIDHDEISGKNMQMFMVSAHATAVQALRLEKVTQGQRLEGAKVSFQAVNDFRRRLDLIAKAQEEPFHFTPDDWSFASEHGIVELAIPALRQASRDYVAHRGQMRQAGGGPPTPKSFKEARSLPTSFLASLPTDVASTSLFAGASEDPALSDPACDILTDLALGSLAASMQLLSSQDSASRYLGVQTLRATQPFYDHSHPEVVDAILKELERPFATRVTLKDGKTLLGGAKKLWVCLCGKEQPIDLERCNDCTRDRRGFRFSDLDPANAQEQLLRLRESIVTALAYRE